MRLRFLAPLLLIACHREVHSPPPVASAPQPAPMPTTEPAGPPAPSATPPPPVVEAPHKLTLRKDELVNGWYWRCSVVEETTHEAIGSATGENVAAGGTEIECTDIAADGKVIVFSNSRGSLGKDARPGKTNNRALPCGEGAYANDLSSCVSIDVSPFMYGGDDPFELRLADISHEKEKVLVSIPKGLQRFDEKRSTFKPRWWDAKYCGNDRLLVVANGSLRLYAAPSGKELAKVAAPKQTAITDCHEDVASGNWLGETSTAAGEKHPWMIHRDGIE